MDMENAVDSFAALAQPTRLAVVKMLVRAGPEGLAAGEIARLAGAPSSTMSAHLAILTRARLVTARRESRSIFYAIDWAGLAALTAYLVEDCCQGRPELCAPLADVVERAAACCD